MNTTAATDATAGNAAEPLNSQGVWGVTVSNGTVGVTAPTTSANARVMWELAEVLSSHGGTAQTQVSRQIWASLAADHTG